MSDIPPPFVRSDDPDRDIRCQDALQFAFDEFLSAAAAAGWSERETLLAIAELASSRMMSHAANENSNSLVELLKRMK